MVAVSQLVSASDVESCADSDQLTRAQFFKKFNPDKIDPDLVILFFAIRDHVIQFTFEAVFQSNIGLDQSDPDRNFSGSPNLDNQCSNRIGNHNVEL